MKVIVKRRRALSNVVTTAILLTAVAVMGTAVVTWSNTNLRTFESNLITSASNDTNKINEIPKIENVALLANTPRLGQSQVSVTVTNIGTIGLTVKQITISDSTQNFVTTVTNGVVTPHSSQVFSYSYAWQHGLLTSVQVTTARGTQISTQVLQP